MISYGPPLLSVKRTMFVYNMSRMKNYILDMFANAPSLILLLRSLVLALTPDRMVWDNESWWDLNKRT